MVSGWGSSARDPMCCHLPRALSKSGDAGRVRGRRAMIPVCQCAAGTGTRTRRTRRRPGPRGPRRATRTGRTGGGPVGPASRAAVPPADRRRSRRGQLAGAVRTTYRWSPEYPRASPPDGAPGPCHGRPRLSAAQAASRSPFRQEVRGERAKRSPGSRLPPDWPIRLRSRSRPRPARGARQQRGGSRWRRTCCRSGHRGNAGRYAERLAQRVGEVPAAPIPLLRCLGQRPGQHLIHRRRQIGPSCRQGWRRPDRCANSTAMPWSRPNGTTPASSS